MPDVATRLTLLAFPQSWDGAEIGLRVLVLPRGDPREALVPGAPAFAQADLVLDAVLVPGLEQMPAPGVEAARERLAVESPNNRGASWDALANLFNIKPAPAGQVLRPPKTRIMKFLTPSYRKAFAFDGPRTEFAVIDDRYKCALTETNLAGRPPRPPLTDEVTWGRVIAFAVKNPLLAERLGLIYKDLTVPAAGRFEKGGFLYATLAATSAYAAEAAAKPELLAVYAARIPPLVEPRTLFGAVLFPVLEAPPGNYDEIFVEAESYDDGFAKIVHGAQPRTMGVADLDPTDPLPIKDVGIQLGWDDEQVAIWLNRRISPDTVEDPLLGVGGYRLDVRPTGSMDWHSMVRLRGEVKIGEMSLGLFQGELAVRTSPVQLLGEKTGDFWLPSFFAAWAGRSIIVSDRAAFEVSGQPSVAANRLMEPVDDDAVPLRYGRDYEFRVRLADLSGGGPEVSGAPRNPAPAPVLRAPFRRFVPPKDISLTRDENRLIVVRPRIGYPDLVFTGFDDPVAALLADTPAALEEGREPGIHDPDVTAVQVAVEVRSLEGDDRLVEGREPFVPLYTTIRRFDPAAPLSAALAIELAFKDVADIAELQTVDPAQPQDGSGPLTLPTAREVRLLLRSVGDPDPQLEYWGSAAARIAQIDVRVDVRAGAKEERHLFVKEIAGEPIRAFLLQGEAMPTSQQAAESALQGRRNEAPADIAQLLAQAIDLDVTGLTFGGRTGRRTVFGCSSGLAHTLAPARSSITFGSRADLTGQWIVVIRVRLNRDWTWDGVSQRGFEVERDGEIVGTIDLPRSVSASVLPGAAKSTTDLVFFDAFDGKPQAGKHPAELTRLYGIRPVFREPAPAADPPLSWRLRLPITTAPRQTPKVVSAGIALSPYTPADDYSSTERRARMLWLEFATAPDDPGDTYFARILGYAPDPMLIDPNEEVPMPAEPSLPIDAESIRVIWPGQPADRAGLDAMQALIPATPENPDDPVRHYLLPLPPGLDASNPRLFGFFVYELRVGHDATRWSTAQARFGPSLRVTGVQHPAPPLDCAVRRLPEEVVVSAPLATPVLNGRNLRPNMPRTEIWALLYAQVTQMDGESRRNVLIGRALGTAEMANTDQRYADQPLMHAIGRFDQNAIRSVLEKLALPLDAPLSVLAAEVYRGALPSSDPLGADLGQLRFLRTSRLMQVPQMCLPA